MAGAKLYKKAPIMIANDVAERLADSKIVENVEAVNPGFLNMDLNKEFLAEYLQKMAADEKFGMDMPKSPGPRRSAGAN